MRTTSTRVFTVLLALMSAPTFGDPAKASKAGAIGDMVKIPAGSFMMGSDAQDARFSPAHKVDVAAFEMDKTLVTNAAYKACMDAGGCTKPRKQESHPELCNLEATGKDNHPANCIPHAEAEAYCKWAKKRLPTEEEWEYAARGSEGRMWPWGDTEPTDDQVCYKRGEMPGPPRRERLKLQGTCEVGTHPSSNTPLGLQDMAGNTEEWTSNPSTSDYSKN